MDEKIDYKNSGVDIKLGDEVSKIFYEAAKRTWENRKGKLGELIVPFDDFSGVRAIDVSGLLDGTLMNMGFDGVGTKMEIAERVGDYSTIAYDLFAMVCDDAVVRGAEPILIGSILDVNLLGGNGGNYIKQIRQFAEGYVGAAKMANVVVVNGEVAELGSRVGGFGPFNCNWGATVVWFVHKDKLFNGHEIKEGDYLVGLEEKGFRSNGFSLARNIVERVYGNDWHEEIFNGKSLGKWFLEPSKIYCSTVVDMIGGYGAESKVEVHGVAHITGGGLPGKIGRVLKVSGLGAEMGDVCEPGEIVKYVQRIGNVSDEEAYKTWNMGQGMVIVTPNPERVMDISLGHGIKSKIIGKVVMGGKIIIKSKGVCSFGEKLEF